MFMRRVSSGPAGVPDHDGDGGALLLRRQRVREEGGALVVMQFVQPLISKESCLNTSEQHVKIPFSSD